MSDRPEPVVTREERRLFDGILDGVLAELPPEIHRLLDEVPLVVEDYPSPELCEEFELEHLDELCGLHDGVPLTDRSLDQSVGMPEEILIFREGIFAMATREDGTVDQAELRKQVRITVLHEIGHHFGLDEDDLAKLGFA
jgi:predicted Zn-dependent protease with MMP-like domain